MKKLIALLTALCLFSAPALGEVAAEESAKLTYEELEMYLSSLQEEMLREGDYLLDSQDGQTWAVSSSAALQLADEELTESTAVVGARVAPGQEDLRGLVVGSSLKDVLSAYPNDNPELFGSRYDAALSIRGDKPETFFGYLLRDGQRVSQVCYAVAHWTEDGVILCQVEYALDQGMVTGITVTGMQDVVEEEAAQEAVLQVVEMQEVTDYFAYPQSEDGTALAPFQREDLSFSGVDFLDLTPEDAIAAWKEPNLDEWTEDSTGEYLRLLQWDGVSAQFLYTADKAFRRVDSLIVTNGDFEGPRGVRPGDGLDTVINRFYRENYAVLAAGEVMLYGDAQGANYGLLSYSASSAALSYSLPLDEGNAVLWYMTFADGELQEMRLLMR